MLSAILRTVLLKAYDLSEENREISKKWDYKF